MKEFCKANDLWLQIPVFLPFILMHPLSASQRSPEYQNIDMTLFKIEISKGPFLYFHPTDLSPGILSICDAQDTSYTAEESHSYQRFLLPTNPKGTGAISLCLPCVLSSLRCSSQPLRTGPLWEVRIQSVYKDKVPCFYFFFFFGIKISFRGYIIWCDLSPHTFQSFTMEDNAPKFVLIYF